MKGINISNCNCYWYIQILINCPTFVLPCKYLYICYNSQRFPITVNEKYIVIRIIVIRFCDNLKLPHSAVFFSIFVALYVYWAIVLRLIAAVESRELHSLDVQ